MGAVGVDADGVEPEGIVSSPWGAFSLAISASRSSIRCWLIGSGAVAVLSKIGCVEQVHEPSVGLLPSVEDWCPVDGFDARPGDPGPHCGL